ncbi:MAG TPA: hypothetical protein VGJ21_12480 [Terracidiphilus sp.]|jgi:hypothetical protein
MKSKLWMPATLCALAGVLGIASARPAAAQEFPTPFVAVVSVNVNNFVYTPVTIPSGMRLVIDYVSLAGSAQASSGPVQPIVLLNTAVADNQSGTFYFAPNPSTLATTQFYSSEKTVIYADTLFVGPAFAGYTPSFMSFNVVISGHLIPLMSESAGPSPGGNIGRPVVPPGIVAPPLSGVSAGPMRR